MKGSFRMEGTATVTGNSGAGGVYVDGGTFIMQDRSSVKDNTRSNNDNGAGVNVINGGTFTMQGNASVTGNNHASGNYYVGYSAGGVYVSKGTFTMKDSASVSGNTSANDRGSGVCVVGTTFTMQGNASVSNNKGTGISVSEGTFTMEGGTISGNTAAVNAGGVYLRTENYSGVAATFTMRSGTISGNTAGVNGGGVRIGSGTFTMQGGVISGNTAGRAGGGVYNYQGKFSMGGSASVSGNTAASKGGGIVIDAEATFTKTGGTIYGDDAEQNLKNTAASKLGCAIYESKTGGWRNSTAGSTMNPDSYGFWLNDGDVVTFPTNFSGNYSGNKKNFTLTFTENTAKSSSTNYLWILTSISGNAYTFKRGDADNTFTITIIVKKEAYSGNQLEISGDSGQNNWNGTWWIVSR